MTLHPQRPLCAPAPVVPPLELEWLHVVFCPSRLCADIVARCLERHRRCVCQVVFDQGEMFAAWRVLGAFRPERLAEVQSWAAGALAMFEQFSPPR